MSTVFSEEKSVFFVGGRGSRDLTLTNLVTNGDFSSAGAGGTEIFTGWTNSAVVVGDSTNGTEVQDVDNGQFHDGTTETTHAANLWNESGNVLVQLVQNGILTVGKTYRVTLDMLDNGGRLDVRDSGTTTLYGRFDGNGAKVSVFVADGTGITIKRVDAGTDITIDNIEIVEWVGDPAPGGCTQDWWDTEVAASDETTALAKLMTATGAPILSLDNQPYTVADDKITEGAGGFAGAEIGMIAYVIENPEPDADVATGRYKITDVDVDGDWIECAGINGDGNTNVDIKIGGAFDELTNACDETAAGNHSVIIYTNLNETLAAAVSISSGGSVQKNTFRRVVGYNVIPGDMSCGGAYYQAPIEILQTGIIDLTKCVTFDADDNAFDILVVSAGVDNLIFENLHLTNTTALAIDCVAGTSANCVFRNCRFSNMLTAVQTELDGVLIDSCYSHDDLTWTPFVFPGRNCNVIQSVLKIGGGNIVLWNNGGSGMAAGNISIGGNFGYRADGAGTTVLIVNNTIVDARTFGVMPDNCNSMAVFNNIFALAPGAIGISPRGGEGGSILYNDYNCFIESDGTPLVAMGNAFVGGEAPVIGAHSIETDPLFVDAANYDFRLKPLSPLINAGKPTNKNKTTIGAITIEVRHLYGLQRGEL